MMYEVPMDPFVDQTRLAQAKPLQERAAAAATHVWRDLRGLVSIACGTYDSSVEPIPDFLSRTRYAVAIAVLVLLLVLLLGAAAIVVGDSAGAEGNVARMHACSAKLQAHVQEAGQETLGSRDVGPCGWFEGDILCVRNPSTGAIEFFKDVTVTPVGNWLAEVTESSPSVHPGIVKKRTRHWELNVRSADPVSGVSVLSRTVVGPYALCIQHLVDLSLGTWLDDDKEIEHKNTEVLAIQTRTRVV